MTASMRAAMMVLASTALSTMWAAPSVACDFLGDATFSEVTFAGQTVPLNAELFVSYVDSFPFDTDAWTLVDPTGALVDARLERDGEHGRVRPERPLTPGEWAVRLNGNDVTFTVADAVDTQAPVAPDVSSENLFRGPQTLIACGIGPLSSLRSITVTLADPAEVSHVLVDGQVVANDSGFVSLAPREADDEPVITVVDFAGNESDAPAARVGGCSSVPTTSLSMLALLLLVRRRVNGTALGIV